MHLLSVTAGSLGQSAEALDSPPDRHGPDGLRHRSKPPSPSICNGGEPVAPSSDRSGPTESAPLRRRDRKSSVWTRDLAVAVQIMHGRRQVPEPPATVHCRTVLVRKPLDAVAVVQAIPWSLHAPLGLLSECSPVGGRARCCAAGSRGAGPVPRFLDASGHTDVDAYVSSDHTRCRRSRISRNNRWRIGRGVGTALAGADSAVYEVAFPFVMFFALAAGPLIGSARRPGPVHLAGCAVVRPDGSGVLAARRGPRTRRRPGWSPRRRRRPSGLATWRNG